MKQFTLTFFFLAMLTAASVNAQVYKSKDAQGRTIFSDKPPAGQVKRAPAQQVEAADEASSDKPATQPKSATPQQSLADKDMEFRKRQKEAAEKSAKDEKERTEAARKQEQCDKLRRYLQVLESGERIVTRDGAGEKNYMEDDTRQREIGKTKENMQECQ